MNILTLFTDVVTIVGEVEVDEGELLAGAPVTLPADIVVGSVADKKVYLVGTLTTTKPTVTPLPVPGGFNIVSIFSDLITIEGDVGVDEGELEAGATVPIPAVLQVATISGTPIYLEASLTTTAP
jgi:hypothetical protein